MWPGLDGWVRVLLYRVNMESARKGVACCCKSPRTPNFLFYEYVRYESYVKMEKCCGVCDRVMCTRYKVTGRALKIVISRYKIKYIQILTVKSLHNSNFELYPIQKAYKLIYFNTLT